MHQNGVFTSGERAKRPRWTLVKEGHGLELDVSSMRQLPPYYADTNGIAADTF